MHVASDRDNYATWKFIEVGRGWLMLATILWVVLPKNSVMAKQREQNSEYIEIRSVSNPRQILLIDGAITLQSEHCKFIYFNIILKKKYIQEVCDRTKSAGSASKNNK